jgi:hypothetical protein
MSLSDLQTVNFLGCEKCNPVVSKVVFPRLFLILTLSLDRSVIGYLLRSLKDNLIGFNFVQ